MKSYFFLCITVNSIHIISFNQAEFFYSTFFKLVRLTLAPIYA